MGATNGQHERGLQRIKELGTMANKGEFGEVRGREVMISLAPTQRRRNVPEAATAAALGLADTPTLVPMHGGWRN